METYTIYDFYNFVQNISIVFSVGFAVILFFVFQLFLTVGIANGIKKKKCKRKSPVIKKKTLSDGTIEITRYREL